MGRDGGRGVSHHYSQLLLPKKLLIVPFSAFVLFDVVAGDLAGGAERFADDGLLSSTLPGSGFATACT